MSLLENVALTGLCLGFLLVVHELGHVIAAKILGLNILKVGFTLKPVPHAYVKVDWPKKKNKRTIFLMSGFAINLALLATGFLAEVSFKPFLLALCIQMVIETNPIYSDFVIINLASKASLEVRRTKSSYSVVYQKLYKEYMHSSKWYLHFAVWILIIITLVNLAKNFVL